MIKSLGAIDFQNTCSLATCLFESPSRTPFTQHSCSVFRLIIVQLVSSVGTCRISPAL